MSTFTFVDINSAVNFSFGCLHRMLSSCLLWINALSSQARIGIGPNKVVLDVVSLGFIHLKTRKNGRKCTIVRLMFKIWGRGHCPSQIPPGACGTRVHFVVHTLQSLPAPMLVWVPVVEVVWRCYCEDPVQRLSDGRCGRRRLLPRVQRSHVCCERGERCSVDSSPRTDHSTQRPRYKEPQWDVVWSREHQPLHAGQ